MSIFGFFSNKEAKSFAVELAGTISVELPPKLIDGSAKILSVNKITAILEAAYAKALEYKRNNQMGMVRQAIFANAFRWKLVELGYPDNFVKVATEGLVLYLSKKK